MAAKKSKFYTEAVIAKFVDASEEEIAAFAFQIEAQTKVNIQANGQIDTGFMLNSTFTATKKASTYSMANKTGVYANKAGRKVARQLAPDRPLPEGASAIVGVGAAYAIYQEAHNSFLYRAAQTVTNQMSKEVKLRIKKRLKDA